MSTASLAIVGSGPAGLSAAIYAASEGLDVTVIDPNPKRGGQAGHAVLIRNLLGFPAGVSGKDLMKRAYRQATGFGVRFLADEAVRLARHDDGRLHIQLAGGSTIHADSVLLTMGVQWRRLNVPGAETTFGVFYGASPDEMARWTGRHIAIIGGANSAGQAAVSFADHGARVDVLSRSPLTKSMSAYLIDEIAARPNITVFEGARPAAFSQSEGTRVEVQTDILPPAIYDGVFVFIGATPRTEWLNLAKDDHGYLLCGALGLPSECSIPGVFAAGDIRSGSTKRVGAAIGDAASAVAQIHSYLAGTATVLAKDHLQVT